MAVIMKDSEVRWGVVGKCRMGSGGRKARGMVERGK